MAKKVTITVDKNVKDVLKLDKAGFELIFDESVDKFPEYKDTVIQQLSFVNQRNYFVSQGLNLGAKRVAKDKPLGITAIPVTPEGGMATEQLKVFNQEAGWHYSWKRPDELRSLQRQGYSVAADEVETFASSGSKGHHEVAAFGKTELVLMKIPEETFKKQQSAVSKKSTERIKGVEATTMAEMRAIGGKPYIPKVKDGHNWSEMEKTPSD